MNSCDRAALASLLWLVLLSDGVRSAEVMELRWLGMEDNVGRLQIVGAGSTAVHLEGSFDLEHWFLLASATPVEGAATFAHTNHEPWGAVFYRASVREVRGSPAVGPQPDASRSVAGLVTPEEGGQLTITDARGVRYDLTVGTNQVAEPVVVSMTVITNFTALPWEDRFRAAVTFEPDGFEFRGGADLRIRFPEPIPELEMVGYAFEAGGEGFHLRPWESSAGEVTLRVTHFSGAGVSAVAFPPAAQPPFHYEQVRRSIRDADRAANQWAGEQYRKLHEQRNRGELSDAEFREALKGIKAQRDRLAFLTGIRPLLDAARRNCEVGTLVLNWLDRLENESGSPYGRSLQFQEAVSLAPQVRCACAHEYVERCERDPASSGRGARASLDAVLDTAARITGRTDAQGCDLGTDTEIDRRFSKAACHKAWEGRVRFTEERREDYELPLTGAPGSAYYTFSSALRDVESFNGFIETLVETDGGAPDENGEGGWAFWKFQLKGELSGGHADSRIGVTITDDFTMTETYFGSGFGKWAALGELSVRVNDGRKVAWVAFSAGLDEVKYPMARKSTTETLVECKPLHERWCPESVPAKTKSDGTRDVSFAAYASDVTADAKISYADGKITATYRRLRLDIAPKPIVRTNSVLETWTAVLWRGEGR